MHMDGFPFQKSAVAQQKIRKSTYTLDKSSILRARRSKKMIQDMKDVFILFKTPCGNHAQEGDRANVAKYYPR